MEIKTHDKHSVNLKTISAEISTLAGVIWREHYTPIIGAEQVEYMLAKFQSPEQICVDIEDNNYTYFTAACPEKQDIIGYCATQPREDYFFLSKIYVRVDYRGKGIARSFLSEVQKSGFEKIRLTVNKNNHGAIAMYRKVGFEKIDEVKTDIGGGFFMDDYIMERMIT